MTPAPSGLLQAFRDSLDGPDVLQTLSVGLIGKTAMVDGPFGPHRLVYADYVASGRALRQVEAFILDEVLPYYANSHTEASYCGAFVTRLRGESRAAIAACCGADARHAVIFAGSGATAGLNRLVSLLGADRGRVRVVIGPYEHHSNILPWREAGAEVVEVAEAATGGPDMAALAQALAAPGCDRVICSLSAASNVTGILTDVEAVTRLVKASGALMVWDYAGGGPYLPIDMAAGGGIDAIVTSPHKFVGGPGASGVLIVRRDAVVTTTPTWPGGGTVRYVSSSAHDYATGIEAREEAGTPNVLGDIRAGLAFLVKDAIGQDRMTALNRRLAARGLAAWAGSAQVEVLGNLTAPRLPIFSLRLRDAAGALIPHLQATRMLSDRYGIQVRGGCACAGPYAHRLLNVDAAQSARLRQAILAGDDTVKPGFVRLNLSVLMSEAEVDFILTSVSALGLAGQTAATRAA
ncbi:aminotransferase class V-fold PLP-dependent enzyme [bacterium]|nr:aminotransferase class V-fold PLP-dependent enzyme [bacterium]